MTDNSDEIVTLVLVYGPMGPHAGSETRLKVTRAQAGDIQEMHTGASTPRVMCFWKNADGEVDGVDVGLETGLAEIHIEDE